MTSGSIETLPEEAAIDAFAHSLSKACTLAGRRPYTRAELAKLLDVSVANVKRAHRITTHGSIALRRAVATKAITIGAPAVLVGIPHADQDWAVALPVDQRRLFLRELLGGDPC